jgi:hypothetical protein
MANLGTTFSRDELPVSQGFEPIPAGWYTATVTGAELKDTKEGAGQYINVQYTVLGPEHQGRVLFGIINIRNASTKAQEIGLSNLNSLMASIGLEKVQDTDQLIGHDCQIKVKIRPAKDGYDAQNDVSGWKAPSGGIKSSAPVIKKPAFAR